MAPAAWLEQFTNQAWSAFAADCGYAVEIARAAATLAELEGRNPAAVDRADADTLRASERRPLLSPLEAPVIAAA